jgi:hypothetical protein
MNDGSSDDPDANKINLPKSLPTCMGRLLTSSREAASSSSSTTSPPEAAAKESGNKRSQPSPAGFIGPGQQRPSRSSSSNKKTQNVDTESTAFYMDITAEFYKRDKSRLEALMVEQKDTLQSDGNTGLVQQCHTQLINNQVRHLSKMYSVLSITKAASLLGIDPISGDAGANSQQVVALLCQSGVLCEVQDDGMIVFGDAVVQGDRSTTGAASTPLVDLAEWMTLLEKVQRLDVNILTSARYQSLVRKEMGGSGGDAKAAGPRGVDDI